MLSQCLSRSATRKWSAALALLLMLGATQQPLALGSARAASHYGSVAGAPHLDRSTALGSLAQAEQTQSTDSSRALSMADALFNGAVRQAFGSQGWHVGALHNTLDWGTVQISNQSVTGSGDWQVDATDETGAGAHLDGTLSFDLEGEAQASNGFAEVSGLDTPAGSTSVFTGTFTGDGAALDFTARLSSSSGSSIATEARYDVSLTRNGATGHVTSLSTGTVEKPAYGFTRTTVKGTVERDGNTREWTNVTTARSFGKGESEVWQEIDALQGNTGAASKITQHSFQRTVGTSISQYVDALEMTKDGKVYSLDKPGSVTGTLDGDFTSELVLVR